MVSISKYGRKVDMTLPIWYDDDEDKNRLVACMSQHCTDELRMRGYVFLRDIYEEFGIPIDEQSIICGWYYDPENKFVDNFVNIQLIKDGDDWYLDFNVDGNISNKF